MARRSRNFAFLDADGSGALGDARAPGGRRRLPPLPPRQARGAREPQPRARPAAAHEGADRAAAPVPSPCSTTAATTRGRRRARRRAHADARAPSTRAVVTGAHFDALADAGSLSVSELQRSRIDQARGTRSRSTSVNCARLHHRHYANWTTDGGRARAPSRPCAWAKRARWAARPRGARARRHARSLEWAAIWHPERDPPA